MRALQTFARLGGRVRAGTMFHTNEERAAYLVSQGLAERMSGPAATTDAGPSEARPAPIPTEVNDEITAVGGGWYEWRGRRYRGKATAEKAREEEG